jgi:hypothetical protein
MSLFKRTADARLLENIINTLIFTEGGGGTPETTEHRGSGHKASQIKTAPRVCSIFFPWFIPNSTPETLIFFGLSDNLRP